VWKKLRREVKKKKNERVLTTWCCLCLFFSNSTMLGERQCLHSTPRNLLWRKCGPKFQHTEILATIRKAERCGVQPPSESFREVTVSCRAQTRGVYPLVYSSSSRSKSHVIRLSQSTWASACCVCKPQHTQVHVEKRWDAVRGKEGGPLRLRVVSVYNCSIRPRCVMSNFTVTFFSFLFIKE
jgi:hypothetical protein